MKHEETHKNQEKPNKFPDCSKTFVSHSDVQCSNPDIVERPRVAKKKRGRKKGAKIGNGE